MDSLRNASAALAVLTIAVALSPAFGQPVTAEPAPAPRAAALVVLDVLVVDATGAPVKGLRAGDFEVSQDGAPVQVASVVGPGRSRGTRSASGDPRGQEILVVVLVDTFTTTESQRETLLAKSDAVVSNLAWGAGVRVMVASGGDTVTVRQSFTADSRLVVEALKAIESGGEVTSAPGPEAGQAHMAPANLTSFVDLLRGLPGRKALVYIGESLPAHLTDASTGVTGDPVRVLADRANAAGVTFYCINMAVSGRPENGAAVQQLKTVAQGEAVEGGAGKEESLQSLVLATGGLAVEMSAGVTNAIANVVRDLKDAYSLSFAAPSQGDGAVHQVKVRVRREGTSVRARSAYLDLKVDDTMAERTLAALSFGVADNPLAIQVSATTESKTGEGAQLATILVSVPLGNLAFAPRVVSHDCDLGLWLAARDSDGHVIRAPKSKFQVSVPNDRLLTALNQTASYTFKVPLKPGGGTFAVTVRDEIAMQAATELTALAPATEPSPGVTP